MFTIIQDSVKGLNELSEQRGAFGEIILSIGERGSLQIRSDGIFLQLYIIIKFVLLSFIDDLMQFIWKFLVEINQRSELLENIQTLELYMLCKII